MKLKEINYKGLLKCLCYIAAAVTITVGATKLLENDYEEYQKKNLGEGYVLVSELKEEKPEYLNYEGKEYYAPEGYYLEVRDNKVCAVREIVDVKDPILQISDSGSKSYLAPSGYYLEGRKAVKRTYDVIEPLTTKPKAK